MKVNLRYVQHFVDRAGRARFYFRRAGFGRVPLPGLPGSPEFMAVYERLLTAPKKTDVAFLPNSLRGVAVHFQTDPASKWNVEYKDSTKRLYRYAFDKMFEHFGTAVFANLTPERVRAIRNKMSEHGTSTGDLCVGLISTLWDHAAERMEMRRLGHDPCLTVKKQHKAKRAHPAWPDEWIKQFEAAASPRMKLVLHLQIALGQRRGDIHRLRWDQYDGDTMRFERQEKRKKIDLTPDARNIPVRGTLKLILDATPRVNEFIINSNRGHPYTKDGLSEAIKGVLKSIGAPDELVMHGLRKTAAKKYSDAGADDREIMAITGHRSTQMVAKYTEQASRTARAKRAADKLEKAG